MIANVGKHQATVLGNTDYEFSFPVKDKIELFGLTIDNELNFKQHITILCEKINNQFNVIRRFRKLISTSTMLRLYKAFILPHFYYCSIVWHFCGKRNTDKMEALNKRILRFILKDNDSNYSQLLEKARTATLFNKRVQNMLLILFKSLYFDNYPKYLKDLFVLRSTTYSLRGTNILSLPKPYTTTYGLQSFRYLATKSWNSLPDYFRSVFNFNEFRNLICSYNFSDNVSSFIRIHNVHISLKFYLIICIFLSYMYIFLVLHPRRY